MPLFIYVHIPWNERGLKSRHSSSLSSGPQGATALRIYFTFFPYTLDMAAPIALRRQLCYSSRIFNGISHLVKYMHFYVTCVLIINHCDCLGWESST